jgi:hypothetical protein
MSQNNRPHTKLMVELPIGTTADEFEAEFQSICDVVAVADLIGEKSLKGEGWWIEDASSRRWKKEKKKVVSKCCRLKS